MPPPAAIGEETQARDEKKKTPEGSSSSDSSTTSVPPKTEPKAPTTLNRADADMDEGAHRASKRKASSAELGDDDAERLRLSSSPEGSNADMPTDSPARQSFVEAQRAEWRRHAEAEVENLMISSVQAVRAVKVGSTVEEESLTQ